MTTVYGKLNNLLTAANAATGESDTTLTDAVQTLIDGYGQGGGGISVDDLATNTAPSGAITLSNSITEIKEYAFAGKPITSIYSPSVTKINQNSLQNTSITDITDANFPVLGVSSRYQINLRINTLKHIKLTGGYIALNSGAYAFRDNTELITAEFPNAGKNESNQRGTVMYFMAGCRKLEFADVGQINNIAAYSFNADSVLTTLILRSTTLVTLNNISAFYGTPFQNGGAGGHIYIPKTLYDALGTGTNDYKAATNWSTIDGYGTITWHAIEGSQYEL